MDGGYASNDSIAVLPCLFFGHSDLFWLIERLDWTEQLPTGAPHRFCFGPNLVT